MWQAVEWSQKAAEQGGANAPFNLGCCCRNGSVEDMEQAVE
jgi:TPR repeat protein